MHFNIGTSLVAALALAAPAFATLTPDQIVGGIGQLNIKVQALTVIALQLNRQNAPLALLNQGPFAQLFAGVGDLINTVNADIAAIRNTPIYNDPDASRIAIAYVEHIGYHTLLLETLYVKAGLFVGLGYIDNPISGGLTQCAAQFKIYSDNLVGCVPSKAQQITVVRTPFVLLLSLTIRSYSLIRL